MLTFPACFYLWPHWVLELFPRGEQGWNLVSFTSMLSSDMWSAVGKSCSWSLGCSSEHSEHRVSWAAKICSSLKLLMSIVLKLCLWKWAVRWYLLIFTKAIFLSLWGHLNLHSDQMVPQAAISSGLVWEGYCFIVSLRAWELQSWLSVLQGDKHWCQVILNLLSNSCFTLQKESGETVR